MDPLSITTSVLAITATASASLKRLRSLRDAPKKISKLTEDLNQLQNIICGVEQALKGATLGTVDSEHGSSHEGNLPKQSFDEDASRLLLRVRRIIQELSQILGNCLCSSLKGSLSTPGEHENPGATSQKFSRVAWLRWRSNVEGLQNELVDVKSNLSTLLGAMILLEVRSVFPRLNKLVMVENGSQLSINAPPQNSPYQSHSDACGCYGLKMGVSGSETRYKPSKTSSTIQARQEEPDSRKGSGGNLSLSSQSKDRPISSIVQLCSYRPAGCPPFCSCICHHPVNLTSPALLASVFGMLSVRNTGSIVPFLRPHTCTEKLCRSSQSAKRTIGYKFPSWLLSRTISIMITSSPIGGPQMQLRTLRIIPSSSDIFRLAMTGDVTRMQALFRDGKASIYDVDERGWSNLHKAYILGQREVFDFLIKAGADVSLVADNGSSIMERAWFFDRAGTGSPGNIAVTYDQSNLDYKIFTTSQQYTVLHKIVLGILPNFDLESHLQASTASIDNADSLGRTPLWWASARGDAGNVNTLLKYGADINLSPGDGHGPIHVARNPEVLYLLLRYGADIDTRDESGRTALHSCCFRGPDQGGTVSLLKALLQAGADVNARSNTENTPLHFAAVYGVTSHIEELFILGADIEAERGVVSARFDARYPDPEIMTLRNYVKLNPLLGMTPLFQAVHQSQTASVKMLLRLGANPKHVTVQDVNIIRVAALKGNTGTLNVLAEADLSGIDPDLRDFRGLNARDYFFRRADLTQDLQQAFENLLFSLESIDRVYTGNNLFCEDSEEEELFEDALETT